MTSKNILINVTFILILLSVSVLHPQSYLEKQGTQAFENFKKSSGLSNKKILDNVSKIHLINNFDSTSSISVLETYKNGFVRKIGLIHDSKGNKTEEVYYRWDGNKWVYEFRSIWEYNEDSKLVLYQSEEIDQGFWTPFNRFSSIYDHNGNLITYVQERKEANEWINVIKENYTYNAYDSVTKYLREIWEVDKWINLDQTIYEYDSYNKLILSISQDWSDDQWNNIKRESYTYNSKGKNILYLFEYWLDDHWNQSQRFQYIYNPNGNMSVEQHENWRDSLWINFERIKYSYDNNYNLIEKLFEQYYDYNWFGAMRFTYTYNFENNPLVFLSELWRNNNWENNNQITYEYIADEKIKILSKAWENNEWVYSDNFVPFYDAFGRFYGFGGSEIEISFNVILDVQKEHQLISDYSLLQNYPNPFNPSTTIEYQVPNTEQGIQNVELRVFDVLGREVAALVNKEQNAGSYKVQFDASNLGSGVYFYQLKAGDFVKSKKMILVK